MSKTVTKYQYGFEQFYEDAGIKIMSDPEQHELAQLIQAPSEQVRAIFVDASAGTGKSTITLGGGIYGVQNDRFDRIIYVRNSEPVEQVGFLPGDLTGKMAEAMAVCTETMDTFQPGLAKRMLELNSVCGQEKQLTLKPVAYLRGKDFSGSPLVIIDEAQNLNLHQLQTVLTRPHDSAKVVIIGSSKQVDPGNKERIGIDNLLAFTVFAKHYEWNPSMLTRTVQLTKNYRGDFSKYADRIQDTVRWLNHNSIYDKEGNEVNARLVSSNGNSVISRECEGYKCYTKERTYHD